MVQVEMPEFKISKTVVSDDDVAKFTRDIKTSDNELVLVGVLPSMSLDFSNTDQYRHENRMQLFIVKKFDTKDGEDAFLELYDETAATVLKFQKWLIEEHQKFKCNPIFKEIDFRTFKADPVRNYHDLYGYMINFNLKTK